MLTTYVHHILFIFSTKYLSKTWTMKLIVVALTFDFTHNRPNSAQKLWRTPQPVFQNENFLW